MCMSSCMSAQIVLPSGRPSRPPASRCSWVNAQAVPGAQGPQAQAEDGQRCGKGIFRDMSTVVTRWMDDDHAQSLILPVPQLCPGHWQAATGAPLAELNLSTLLKAVRPRLVQLILCQPARHLAHVSRTATDLAALLPCW